MMEPARRPLFARTAVAIALSTATSCSSVPDQPLPVDKVRDAAAAIAIGKKSCDDRGGDTDGQWTASFHAGVWTVEKIFPNADPKCNSDRVRVWADNAKSDLCEECAVVT